MRKQWAYILSFYRIRVYFFRLALLQEQQTLTLGQLHDTTYLL